MPRLENKKWEAFARSVAEGESRSDAYRLHVATDGEIKANSIWQSASRLYNDEKVSSRIQELRELLDDDGPWVMSKKEMMAYWTRVGRTPLEQVDESSDMAQEVTYEVKGGGARGKLKRGNYDSGNEVEEEAVEVVKIKMVGKKDALSELAKLRGYYKEQAIAEEQTNVLAQIANTVSGWKAPQKTE